jgi:hypothetical protein
MLHKPVRVIRIMPDFNYSDRVLELFICEVCGKITAELTQFNIKHQKIKKKRLEKRRLANYIALLKDGSWKEIPVDFGTKSRAGFSYGVNKKDKDGKIYQYSVDFNGTKTLVKVLP